jgi:hypothetical protein
VFDVKSVKCFLCEKRVFVDEQLAANFDFLVLAFIHGAVKTHVV